MLEPNENLRMIARVYCSLYGLDAPIEGHNARIDAEIGARIAAEYDALPKTDPDARRAYWALRDEIRAQYKCLLDAGYTFIFTSDDPYTSSAEMRDDVRRNKRLRVFTGGEEHPFLGWDNNLFRAVHDIFGHAAEGYEFGPRGEHNAWIHHSMMFSPLAQRALTTDTRGQNSWFNFGPKPGQFAEQKAALMPEWVSDWRSAIE